MAIARVNSQDEGNMTELNKDHFLKNFLPSSIIPVELIRLLEYQNSVSGDDYSGHFYLYDRFWEDTRSYFDDYELQRHFAFFGLDADGSIYAFWKHDEFELPRAPVVFLASDGGFSIVLANSFREFLALLALGVDELGYAVAMKLDWNSKLSADERNIKFRHWLQNELGISVPSNPSMIVAEAQETHPDLEDWIESHRTFPKNDR